MGPQHAYGLATRLEQVTEHPLTLNQGTLYPALVRLEQKGWIKGAWQKTEHNREAKYYGITRAGERALEKETEKWRRLAGLVDKLLTDVPN
jgi:transcriptional regulator